MKRLFLSLVLSLLMVGSVFAADSTKYISPDGTGDGNTSGSPDTFLDAWVALRTTDGNHTIIFIEAGTYYATSAIATWNDTGDSLTLQADTGLTADDVILDMMSENRHMIFNQAGCDFTVTNITIQNVTMTDTPGAIRFYRGQHLIVSGCKFLNNLGLSPNDCNGGALRTKDSITGNITVTNSTFSENSCDNGSEAGFGGAIYAKHPGNITITNCVFTNNYAAGSGGAFYVADTVGEIRLSGNTWSGNTVDENTPSQGGAICFAKNTVDDIIIDGDIFTNNSSWAIGIGGAAGAVKFSEGASGIIRNCLFSGNGSNNAGAVDFGGSYAVTSTLTNNIFINNSAEKGGAWEALTEHSVNAYNNSYYGNTASNSERGADVNIAGYVGNTATLRNEIHQVNDTFNSTQNTVIAVYATEDTTLDIQYCNIEGGADAVTNAGTYASNKNEDPKFYKASSGELMLRSTSPCIDQGTDVSITYDYLGRRIPNGSAPDMGAYEYYQKAYGSMHQSVCQKTSSTTLMTVESGLVNLDSTSGAMTIYLPPLSLSRGLSFFLHRDNDGANGIVIYANEYGGTIGGEASKSLATQYSTLLLKGGVDQWYCQPYAP